MSAAETAALKNFLKSLGIKLFNMPKIPGTSVEPLQSATCKTKPLLGFMIVTIKLDNKNVAENINTNTNNVIGTNLFFSFVELYIDTDIVVTTTGTTIYLRIVM